jgi:hypothetical protein
MKKKNLLQTIFLVISFNVINQFAKAQIVYTDVNPDKVYKCTKNGCTQTYSLDLNSDGIIDFNFITTAQSSKTGRNYNYSASVVPLNKNSVTVFDPANSLPLALPYGATIQSGLTWW